MKSNSHTAHFIYATFRCRLYCYFNNSNLFMLLKIQKYFYFCCQQNIKEDFSNLWWFWQIQLFAPISVLISSLSGHLICVDFLFKILLLDEKCAHFAFQKRGKKQWFIICDKMHNMRNSLILISHLELLFSCQYRICIEVTSQQQHSMIFLINYFESIVMMTQGR